MSQLIADFEFAMGCQDEFKSRNGGFMAPLLRYVAAINPECSKKEFVAAMTKCGVNPNTAAIQFTASRKFDLDNN